LGAYRAVYDAMIATSSVQRLFPGPQIVTGLVYRLSPMHEQRRNFIRDYRKIWFSIIPNCINWNAKAASSLKAFFWLSPIATWKSGSPAQIFGWAMVGDRMVEGNHVDVGVQSKRLAKLRIRERCRAEDGRQVSAKMPIPSTSGTRPRGVTKTLGVVVLVLGIDSGERCLLDRTE
jgi:hypothetical protein